MSGLFGRKGSDNAERQQAIKKYLNKELSQNIKKLQRDHISSASAIRSGETVNRICSCLEAIFLHELKESYSSKTFWPFVTKFTHRDVLEQIKQLLFIRTEIGKCRAWIRMAVNDCLMDSYLSAMMREPSTLKHHYKQGAFLRDHELPLIADDYLQGMTVFTFQLSCNSSVLNMWDTALLLLSGANLSKDTDAVTEKKDSQSDPTDAGKRPSNASFHESEMSPSLLVDDTSPGKGAGSPGSPKTLDVGSPVTVEELDDSVVIDFVETAGAETKPPSMRVSGEMSESDLRGMPDQRVEHVPSTDAEAHPKGLSVESMNPFISSLSPMDEGGELVYSRHTVPTGKQKKKKKGRKVAESDSTSGFESHSGSGQVESLGSGSVDGAVVSEEVEQRMEGVSHGVGGHDERDKCEPSVRTLLQQAEAGVGRTDKFPNCDISDNNDDIYNVQAESDGGGTLDLDKLRHGGRDTVEKVPEETVVGRVDDVRSLEGDRELEDYETVERQPDRGEGEPAPNGDLEGPTSKEESFEGSFGNSLSGMQGWSSDFERLAVPEAAAEKSMVESQESYSTMVGKYIQNTAPTTISVPESLTQSDDTERAPEEDEEKQKTSQEDMPEMIEDFEVIPVTNGPLSKYADDRTQELLDMVTKIGREKGLAAQKFQCRGCSCELGIIFGKHRVCNYNGYYYCSECHLDEQAVIPARILYNWDFRKHPVACHTRLFLNQIEDMPLIDVEKCNPPLYGAVSEMEQILVLRRQIVYLKAYLFTCKESVAEELRSKIWPRDYMLENCHLYSVKDFLQVQNGTLGPQLKKIIVFAAKHVQQCALCSQKGFICEICENPKIIYPFDTELTVRCEKCRSVYHKACKTEIAPCPRCLRRKMKSPGDGDGQERTEFPSPFT